MENQLTLSHYWNDVLQFNPRIIVVQIELFDWMDAVEIDGLRLILMLLCVCVIMFAF